MARSSVCCSSSAPLELLNDKGARSGHQLHLAETSERSAAEQDARDAAAIKAILAKAAVTKRQKSEACVLL